MTPPNFFTYSSARRMTSGSLTQLPSSLNTRTCATESAIAPISAKTFPSSPCVTAPIGKTSRRPALLPSRYTCSTTPALSATGEVLAIAESATYPPLTPAREPERTVSESSLPGSRRWVCRSTNPDITIIDVASRIAASESFNDGATECMRPFLISTSQTRPSASVPFLMRVFVVSLLIIGPPQSKYPQLKEDKESPFAH